MPWQHENLSQDHERPFSSLAASNASIDRGLRFNGCGATGIGYERAGVFDDLIETDVEAAMYGQNASAYVRLPFTLADPHEIYSLSWAWSARLAA